MHDDRRWTPERDALDLLVAATRRRAVERLWEGVR